MRTENHYKRMLWCLLAGSLIFLGGCAMGGAAGTKTLEGISALEAGEYEQAQLLFAEAALDGEQQMLAYRGLGMAYMGLAQYKDAGKAFEAALASTDDRMRGNILDIELHLATAQYRDGDYEETIATCDRILEDYENADAYFLRGAGRLSEDMQEEAGADFDAAAALNSEDYDLYLDIYECYRKRNLSGLGSRYLQSALAIQGEDMEHYYHRGRIYYYLENYEEAQLQLMGPAQVKYEPAMYLLARVYLALEDYMHAQAEYRQIEEEFGQSTAVCNGLALCAISSGDYELALSCIAQGLAMETGDKQELYFNEIVAYERMQDFAAAKAKAQEYIRQYPSDEAGMREWTFLATR